MAHSFPTPAPPPSLPKSHPDAQRILIIRPSALGDVVRSTPVLVSLRDAYPKAQIDWLVQDSFVDAVRWHPALSNAIAFPRKSFNRISAWLPQGAGWRFLTSLRRSNYDLVFDCQGLARSGFFAWSTRASTRIGFRDAREGGWIGVNHRVEVPSAMHTVDRMLMLVESAGIVARRDAASQSLHAGTDARSWAAQRLGISETGYPRPYAVLAPTSRWPGKQWPADRFAVVAKHLADRGVVVVVVGAGSERGQIIPVLELAKRSPLVLDLLGQTSISQLMAIIERCGVLVANDSAALHMGVAYHKPVVALYGPTSVATVGPYRREADVIQHVGPDDVLDHKNEATGRKLMERIGVDEVIQAADARMKKA